MNCFLCLPLFIVKKNLKNLSLHGLHREQQLSLYINDLKV